MVNIFTLDCNMHSRPSMKYKGKEHEADLRQVIPNLALYSVDEKGAKFATFGGIAGGEEWNIKVLPD